MKNILQPLIDSIKPDEIFSLDQVKETLGLTIKKDDNSKLITFLAMTSAYTGDGAFNLAFLAPSSTGKSYIPMQIAKLFPEEDVIKVAYSSPTAFFHQEGEYNPETNTHTINLSRKILIFQDMPHPQLLEKLRTLLSHDDKILRSQITDKDQKGGNSTKNIELIGFPVVIYCTANSKMDEQEGTRFILLSPELNQEKIRFGIITKAQREANPQEYRNVLENDALRLLLAKRIRKIRNAGIDEVLVSKEDTDYIVEEFTRLRPALKPRHQRDIGRVFSVIKSITLLNFMFKKREGNNIWVERADIDEALNIWNEIAIPQEMNLPPFIVDIYFEVILPCYLEKNQLGVEKQGVSRREVAAYYYKIRKVTIDQAKFRQEILPALKDAGVIYEIADEADKRNKLLFVNLFDKDSIYKFNQGEPVKDTFPGELGPIVDDEDVEKLDDQYPF